MGYELPESFGPHSHMRVPNVLLAFITFLAMSLKIVPITIYSGETISTETW